MATRPIWQGYLRLSLVTCPVALYSATNRGHDIAFHMLHKQTHNRIRMVPNDPELGPVSREDIVKGYEFEKNKYVIVTKEELDAVRLESTKTIEIEEFVDEKDIDRIYWKEPYYMVPTGKAGTEAFLVIREAMRDSGKVGLGRIVMHTRERVIAIEPRGEGMLVTTLRSSDEVRDSGDVFDTIPKAKIDKQMLEIADRIIDQQMGEFAPNLFTDRYEQALREIIREKERGQPVPTHAPVSDQGKVVDLMEALKRSLRQSETRRGEPGNARGKAPRRNAKAPPKAAHAARAAGHRRAAARH